MQSFTYGNGIVHTLTRNVRGLPDRSLDAYGTTKILDDGYDYDANGNVAAISDGATGRNQRGNRTMAYDGLNRLVAVQSPMYGSTGAAYGYDSLDNLTQVVAPGRHHYYCYDGNNRLTNVRTGDCTTMAGATVIGLGYDLQGNLNNKNGVLYTFDQGNRLRSVSSPASTYVYDGHGRRVRDNTGAARYSLYSLSGQLVFAQNNRETIQRWYVSLNGSLVAIREQPTGGGTASTTYQHTDALGSPVAVTNENQVVIKRNEYESYGKLVGAAMEDGPGYTGHMSDAATGLVYMQQRYYDEELGRFLSVDPVSANRGGGFNRYAYVANNPYRYLDPDGRELRASDRYCDNGAYQCSDVGGAVWTDERASDHSDSSTKPTNNTGAPTAQINEWMNSKDANDRLRAALTAIILFKIKTHGEWLQVTVRTGGQPAWSGRGVVTLYAEAYTSWAWLASTLGHEFEGHYDGLGYSPIELSQSEVNAYKYSIDMVKRFGNSSSEEAHFRERYHFHLKEYELWKRSRGE